MKPEDLRLFIKEGEGLTVEFKEKYSSKIDKDIVALANAKGGFIIFGFPSGLLPQDFGNTSVRRNLIIADLFHRMGKVERIGSGIKRMRDLMKDAGLKEPQFEMTTFFRTSFYRDPRYSLKEKVGEKVPEKVTENQQKIIKTISQNQHITISELSNIVGISDRKIKENILKLKTKGLLRRIGPDKGGHWEVL